MKTSQATPSYYPWFSSQINNLNTALPLGQILDVLTNLPSRLPITVLVLVEALHWAILDRVYLIILDTQGLEARFLDDGAVDDCDCFSQLGLVAQLVVEVHAREKDVELWVCVDPA